MTVRVVTAAGAAARDAAAIAAGTPSRVLMRTAGAAAAQVIQARCADRLRGGVLVVTGSGNNGGDGWVVARHLAAAGLAVRVHEAAQSRTGDAFAEREVSLPHVTSGPGGDGGEAIVVDALLGTGARGAPSGAMATAVDDINRRRAAGAMVVSLDIPTGVSADQGVGPLAVSADLTIAFGTLKRGHLLARGHCGAVVVVDIGLGAHADLPDEAPVLVDESLVARTVPDIAVDAHKGTRRRVVICGGARGMAGAVALAASAASRSGIGMVRLLVEGPSLAPVQASAPEATAATWPATSQELAAILSGYAHAVLAGPGLRTSSDSKGVLDALLEAWQGPTILDADAITRFEGDLHGLAAALAGRPALLTPHVRELARLIGTDVDEVIANRFDVARDAARILGASILLKGVPTVVTSPTGESMVSASGNQVLATAGSGDVLGGIAVTLLAQTGDPFLSGACAAWIHGRAAEIAAAGRTVRGVTLADVLDGLGHAWRLSASAPPLPVLAELPSVR